MSIIASPRRKALYRPEFVLPNLAFSAVAMKGSVLVDLRRLGIIPQIAGGDVSTDRKRGYNAAADLVTQTSDGVDLNELWDEYTAVVAEANAERQTMIDFLTFPVTNPTERVAQVSGADFEKASEYGVPVGVRPSTAYFMLGYDFEWYDMASRYTWKFLADSPRNQIDAITAMSLEADNRNIFDKVMNSLFDPTNRTADINGIQDVNVYALYNGDGTVPPRYKSNVFNGSHTHYLVSGAATIDPGDLDEMINDLKSHGYSSQNGMTLVLLANTREVDKIKTFRIANGASADFIPATGQPGMFLDANTTILGNGQPASTYRGLNVKGSYNDVLIIEEDSVPAGYVSMIATGGRANLNNPVGLREHSNPSLRGLRLVKGPNPDYPLVDSYYQRGFGTGIRQRGGAIVMQIKASGAYAKPASF